MIEIPGFVRGESLATGVRAAVFRAKRDRDGQSVVLKVLTAAAPRATDLAGYRFAYALTRGLEHPNVCRSIDLVEADRRPVLVMEDIGARSLRELMLERRLSVDEVLSIGAQVASGLAYLHSRGVLHKDINPSNIVLAPDGLVQIVDFDLASPLPRESTTLLTAARMEGTLAYISPEQTGRMTLSLDQRSDLYSLGVTLYEALTGRLPFTDTDPLTLVHHHIAVLPVHVAERAPNVPAPLAALVMRLLAKTPEERYQSAPGLRWDLLQLREALSRGEAVPFPLGRQDRFGRIQLSNRLVGREREEAELAAAVGRISQGAAEVLLVGGYAGVGKSKLVHSVHKAVTRVSGRFAAGKYNQLQNLPYSGVVQIIQTLVLDLVAESDARLAAARARTLETLGPLAGVVVEAVPQAGLLLGALPPPAPVPPVEAQNRFMLAMVRFFQGLACAEEPLILFADDLQWADASTLGWIRALSTDGATRHILLLGAYRDHEVGPGHALTRMIEELVAAEKPANLLTLAPLDQASVSRIVADALRCPVADSEPLARLLMGRSGGNPFFLERLLRKLHEDGALRQSAETGQWIWDLDEVSRLGISENVAELMAGELQRLPERARALLQQAACIGSSFDLETLALVADAPVGVVATALLPALTEDFLATVGPGWRYAGELDAGAGRAGAGRDVVYRFVHDRVQEAAYASVPEAERAAIHWRIGQRLSEGLGLLGADAGRARLLDAVNHLNLGRTYPHGVEALARLAWVNQEAMTLARTANAYAAALEYGRVGLTVLDEAAQAGPALIEGPGISRALELDLCLGVSDTARICGEMDLAASALARAEGLVESVEERIRVALVRIALAEHASRFQDAVDAALDALALYGLSRPRTPEEWGQETGAAMGAAEAALAGQDVGSFLDLPLMQDADALVQMRLLGHAASAAATIPSAFPLVIARMITLSVTKGNSPQSPAAYVFFGFMGAAMGAYGRAAAFGELGVALAARLQAGLAVCEQMYGAFICSWTRPFSEAVAHGERAVSVGLETGSFLPATWASMNLGGMRLAASEELGAVLADMQRSLALVRATLRVPDAVTFFHAARYPVLRLIGDADAIDALDAECEGEEAALASLVHYPMVVLGVRVVRLESLVLLGEDEAAVQEAALARALEPMGPGLFYLPDLVSYCCLARTARWAQASDEERAAWTAQLDADLARLATWADVCPANHQARHRLVAAERARILGQTREAAELFDSAIESAQHSGLLALELVALERCGQMFLGLGRRVLGLGYLAEARFAAVRLGAQEKVTRLEAAYPALLSAGQRANDPTITSRPAVSLDVYAVIEATQAISAEIELERLLDRALRVLLADAGAERVALILSQDGEALVQAEGRAGDDQPTLLGGGPLSDREDLPAEVLRYVLRSGNHVLLDDAMNEGAFRAVPYIQSAGVRSLMAAPLSHQGKNLGAIYLENTLTPGAFTPDRVALIRLLGAQVATSLENALLYERLRARSAELQQKNEQLRELDRVRDDFLARTSHELRTPLHGIIGLAQSLMTGGERPTQEQQSLGMIVHSGRRLSNLLGDLLDLSTLQRRELSLVRAPVAMGELIDGVLGLCKPLLGRKDLVLKADLPADLPPVFADQDRVEQVLFNLVGNAIKFTARGQVTVRAAVDGEQLRVSVLDTGKGIAPDALGHIFRPFSQEDEATAARYGGTGIGLSVAQEIVRLHGGSLTATSMQGQGSEFSFTLPLARGASLLSQPRASERAPVGEVQLVPAIAPESGLSVLVVDDEPVNLQVLVNQLGQAGYRVETATSGEDALTRLSEGYRPDIILLDVMMPMMDGMEVCRQLRAHMPMSQLPIIMLTARTQTDDLVAGLRSGANDYVTKPFSGEELLARIRTHLQLARIHRAINQFVPYPFMRLLGRDSIVDLRLGDSVEREMSVLFSDMRSFTELVETMSPMECFQFINEFLAAILPQVASHDGFVDKVLGDGVLALFQGSADDAVRAALAMHAAVAELSERRVASGHRPVLIGVGIHTGKLMLGTVGDASQMSATVVSDAVNLSSRLSGLNKHYGAGVLISEETRSRLTHPGSFSMRALDNVTVQGRVAAVPVYEVFDADPPAVRAAKEATRPSFESAVKLFHARNFAEAQRLFRLCLAMDPNDAVSLLYLDRCSAILRQLAGGGVQY